MELLKIKGLKKNYINEKQVICALKSINLTVFENEFLVIVGPSGCGKSTILSLIGNLEEKSGGKIEVKPGLKVGYMFQEDALFPWLTVLENCLIGLKIKGDLSKENKLYVKNLLKKYGLSSFEKSYPKQLSGGMRQRVALIRTLALRPDILLLDEPFSGLDPVNAMLLKDVVKEQISQGKIVLFSSHQMAYIEEFCDSIAILSAGRVAISGDLIEIKRNYVRDKLVVSTTKPERIKSDLGGACAEREDSTLLIQLTSPAEKQSMMKRLVESYDIDEVKVFEPSLNDIFVEYAGAQV